AAETLASSPLCLACLTRSRRRSSVSWGTATRIRVPSLLGFSPRSELRIAVSMACSWLASYGFGGAQPRLGDIDAGQLGNRGVRTVVVDDNPGEHARVGAAGPDGRQVVTGHRHRL